MYLDKPGKILMLIVAQMLSWNLSCSHTFEKPVKYSDKLTVIVKVLELYMVWAFQLVISCFVLKGHSSCVLSCFRLFLFFYSLVLIVRPTLMSFTCLVNLPSFMYLSRCPSLFAHFFFWCLMLWPPHAYDSMFLGGFLCLIFCLILDCLLVLALACLTTHKPCLLSLINQCWTTSALPSVSEFGSTSLLMIGPYSSKNNPL